MPLHQRGMGLMSMVIAKANANFYSLYGSSDPDDKTAQYNEYRRCWTEYPARFTVRDFPIHLDI